MQNNFRYVQFLTPNGIGYACISLSWEKKDSLINYQAGVSFCSPKDVFDKARARNVAQNRRIGVRLKSRNRHYDSSVLVKDNTKFISNAEFDLIMRDIMRNMNPDYVPTWAVKSVNQHKYILGLSEHQNEPKKKNKMIKEPVTEV